MTTRARALRAVVLAGDSPAALEAAVNEWLASARERKVFSVVPAGDLAVLILYTEG